LNIGFKRLGSVWSGIKISGKIRKAIPAKLKVLLQKEIGSRCPFCANEDVEHFNVHHIDGDRSNDHPGNLIMICPICHSKIHNGDIAEPTVRQRKLYLQNTRMGAAQTMRKVINFHSRVHGSVVGDHNTVTIKISKKSVNKYPDGCIGSDVIKNAYISYLITRYHEYKEYEVGKENMIYRIFPAALKSV
jgi:hypothetical protein